MTREPGHAPGHAPGREPTWRRVARLHGPDVRRDVDDEFDFHLQMREAELVEAGLSAEAARAEALRRFGDLPAARATCAAAGERRARRARLAGLLGGLALDLRHAARGLRRRPGFAASVVLTVALGIGVNAALFSVVNALLLRPLPVERPAELVRVYLSQARISSPADRYGGTSYADHLDLRGLRHAFAGVAAYMPVAAGLRTRDGTTPVAVEAVSGGYFRLLGVRPAAGRLLAPDEDGRTAAPAAVLAYGFWRRHFGGDPAVVGATVVLSGVPFTVVGVAPAQFTGVGLRAVDLYVPFGAAALLLGDADRRADRAYRVASVIARLAPGVSLTRAEREAEAAMRAVAREHPETNAGRHVTLTPARSVLAASTAEVPGPRVALLLLSITGVVFAVALLNVAGLVLARAAGRGREIAVRLALGAGRARVARQLLVDGALLALASGAVALAALPALPALARRLGVPPAVRVDPDWPVVAFTLGAALVASVVLGLTPLARVRAARPAGALREGQATPAGARGRRALVAGQVALSVLLLVLGLGLADGLRRQRGAGPGFPVERLLVARFRDLGAPSPQRERALVAELVRRARAVPGVVAVTTALNAPLASEGFRTTVAIPGYAPAPDEDMQIAAARVGPDYFRTLGVRLRAGEELGVELGGTGADTAPRVVVNASMARRYWAGRDPVGAELRVDGARLRVVAVAEDFRLRSLAEAPRPTFFLQRAGGGGTTLLVRTADDPARVGQRLRARLADVSGDLVVDQIAPMSDVVGESLAVTRLAAAGVGAFAALTLALALVGLYGLVSYLVSQRTHEFGVRLALGARPRDLSALVLRQGLVLAGGGAAAGIALGLAAARVVASLAPGVAPPGPAPVGGAAALLLLAAAGATLAPARRATAANPAETLRAE